MNREAADAAALHAKGMGALQDYSSQLAQSSVFRRALYGGRFGQGQ